MKNLKLKPCPHCGCKAELFNASKRYVELKVICQTDVCINSAVKVTYFREDHAIAAWNKRAKK